MDSILPWIQIVLSVFLVIIILIQQSDAGIGDAFGGGGDSDAVGHTRRGAEKTIFRLTITIAVLFAVSALLAILL